MKDLLLAHIEQNDCVLEYTAKLSGKVNDLEILVNGSGNILLEDGLTKGDYEIEKSPDGFSPLFLTAVLITGYPNACAPLDGSKNVFHGSSYNYKRTLVFRQGERLTMTAKCFLSGNVLDSVFEISGNVPKVELDAVEPLVEVWEPADNNQIRGQFRIAWKKNGKVVVSADAQSEYYPGNSTEFMPVLHRFISISHELQDRKLSLNQKSLMFHQLTDRSD